MAGFLYYFGGVGTVPSRDVSRLPDVYSLRETLDGASWGSRPVASGPGPNAGAGVVIAPAPPLGGVEASTAISLAAQRWIRLDAEDGPGVWLGFWIHDPPRPIDLARSEAPIVGANVTLLDGNAWIVPTLPGVASTLPEVFAWDGRGVARRQEKRFESIVAEASVWWDRFISDAFGAGWDEIFDYSVRVLGINYRVGPAEVAALELMATTNVFAVLHASLGVEQLRAALAAKKKES